jgi:hypothetical protein
MLGQSELLSSRPLGATQPVQQPVQQQAPQPATQGAGPYSDLNYVNGLDLQSDQDAMQAQAASNRTALNASNLAADPTYYAVQPTIDNRALLNAAERASNPDAYASVQGTSRTARSGDTVSGMIGTSDPQAVGNFMRANNMTSSTLRMGGNYFATARSISTHG